MTTQTAIAIGLVLYVVLTTAVSFFMMSRVRKSTDYLVAGRGLPYWVLTGTIIGTCIGTGVIIGGAGLAYQHGWAGCAYPIGLGVGTLITGLCFSKMRQYKFMTLSEEVACYYEGKKPIVEFSNITLFLSQLCWLTAQIIGGAMVLQAVTGLKYETCVIIAGFAKAIITIPGGLKAVVYTDVLQTIILFCGFGFLMHSALADAGGVAGLSQKVPADYNSFLGVKSMGTWEVVSLIVALVLNPIADPGRRLTIYSSSSEKSATWSMVSSGIAVIVFSVCIGVTGMYAYSINPALPKADEALPWLVMHQLPTWLAALVVVAIVSGMSSAANGNAAAAGTFFVRHIFPLVTGRFPKNPVLVVRISLVFGFIASTIMALFSGSIVDFVTTFLPMTMSGLGVIILLGRFWKRSTWQGALAALIAVPVVSVIVLNVPVLSSFFHKPIIPATLVGLLAHVVVTLMTPPPTRSFEEVAKALDIERAQVEGHVSGKSSAASIPSLH